MHAAEAGQEQVVSEAFGHDSESSTTKTAPTLPGMKKTARVLPTRGTAAEKETPSSSNKQAKERRKESEKAEETDGENADEENEEEDPDHVLETQQKQKPAPTSYFDASPDDASNDQPKKKLKTSARTEVKPALCSGSQPSSGTVDSPMVEVRSQEACLPSWPRWHHRRRSRSRLAKLLFLILQSCVREVSRTCLRRECIYMPLKACTVLQSFYLSKCTYCLSCCAFPSLLTQLFARL